MKNSSFFNVQGSVTLKLLSLIEKAFSLKIDCDMRGGGEDILFSGEVFLIYLN